MNRRNKNHWYDGQFYDRVIAPYQDKAFVHVRSLVADGATLLDVGCGTGRLVFQLADKCDRIVGIDPSAKNIKVAQQKLVGQPSDNIRFHNIDALGFIAEQSLRYDYATVSYVIHEIDKADRNAFLQNLSSIARHIIIVDYLVPRKNGFQGMLTEAVEFAAGWDHYRNFRSFITGPGLKELLEKAGLTILSEIKDNPPSSHIVLATRKQGDSIE